MPDVQKISKDFSSIEISNEPMKLGRLVHMRNCFKSTITNMVVMRNFDVISDKIIVGRIYMKQHDLQKLNNNNNST
jgi:hypothetical protein